MRRTVCRWVCDPTCPGRPAYNLKDNDTRAGYINKYTGHKSVIERAVKTTCPQLSVTRRGQTFNNSDIALRWTSDMSEADSGSGVVLQSLESEVWCKSEMRLNSNTATLADQHTVPCRVGFLHVDKSDTRIRHSVGTRLVYRDTWETIYQYACTIPDIKKGQRARRHRSGHNRNSCTYRTNLDALVWSNLAW